MRVVTLACICLAAGLCGGFAHLLLRNADTARVSAGSAESTVSRRMRTLSSFQACLLAFPGVDLSTCSTSDLPGVSARPQQFELDYRQMVAKLEDALLTHVQNLRDVAEETAADIRMPPGSRVILKNLEASQ